MTRQFKLITMLVLASFVTVACSPADSGKDDTDITPSVTVVISSGDEVTSDEPIHYVISATDFKYSPNLIEAEVGKTLRIKVTSDGTHDFVIDELGIDTGLIDGETIVEITIPTEALDEVYEFYCSVGNHRQMGMTGTLIVHAPQQQ